MPSLKNVSGRVNAQIAAVAKAASGRAPAAPTKLLNAAGTKPGLPKTASAPFYARPAATLARAASIASALESVAPADLKKLQAQKDLAASYGLPGERMIDFYDGSTRNGQAFEKLTGVDLAVVPQYQGNQNACGTTSLAQMMDYWNPGRPGNDHFTIDKSIRTVDTFTAPDDLVKYAKDHGYRAGMKTDADLGDIKKMLDQGVPVQVLLEPLNSSDKNGKPDRSDFGIHYVTVTGYELGADGKVSKLSISDPWGLHYTMSAENFMDRWSNLKTGYVPTGINRLMIAYVPNDSRTIVGPDGKARKASDIDLPKNSLLGQIFNDANAGRGIGQGVMNTINGVKQGNPLKAAVGVWQAVNNVVPLIGTALGSWAKEGGSAAIDWGKKKWNQGGVGNKIVGGAAVVGGAIAYGVGWAVTKVSAATSYVVNTIAKGATKVAEKVWDGVKTVAKGVASAAKAVASGVKSAAKAVGKAVKKIFSGW